ncbi:MAG: ribosomal protein S18-alanine N-acetyltransferase, partial [Deltaproteobacteria bacterium]|nr:ribosomal protein S18-alanine N-acetyltransferase [Deltaproteobacteria bacterium]
MTGVIPVAFRPATASDVDAIWAIEQVSFPSPWPRFSFWEELRNPISHVLVAGSPPYSEEIWGYVVYWLVADEMHILNLAVHPAYRRQGIARRLLQEALHRARGLGARQAWLEVRPSNQAAQSLYHSLGFKPVATRKRYYHNTGEDAL